MTKTISYTLLALISLTIITATVSNFIDLKISVFLILTLSAIKFIFVSFQFMELKKANLFWKMTLSIYLLFFITIILLIL